MGHWQPEIDTGWGKTDRSACLTTVAISRIGSSTPQPATPSPACCFRVGSGVDAPAGMRGARVSVLLRCAYGMPADCRNYAKVACGGYLYKTRYVTGVRGGVDAGWQHLQRVTPPTHV
jgi:hypothetical protein